jgi:hypothetical protein
MFLSILGFITGLAGPLFTTANKVIDLQAQKAAARSNEEIRKIDADLEATQARKAVLIAEAGNRIAGALNASVRLLLTLPGLVVLSKLMIWDKVIGSFYGCAGSGGSQLHCTTFRTDALDTNQWAVITAIIAFYFVYDIAARFKR